MIREADATRALLVQSPAMRTSIVLMAAATCLSPAPALAQTCLGRASFADAPWQLRLESSFSSDAKTFGPSLSLGSRNVFGGVLGDITGYSTIDQTALSIGGTIGIDGALDEQSHLHVCPIATLIHRFGPNVPTADFSSTVAAFGGRVGVVAAENQTLQVIPTIGVEAQVEDDTVKVGADTTSETRTFAVVRFGVGFVLNRRTAIVPEIIDLYGVASNTTFRVSATFQFGK